MSVSLKYSLSLPMTPDTVGVPPAPTRGDVSVSASDTDVVVDRSGPHSHTQSAPHTNPPSMCLYHCLLMLTVVCGLGLVGVACVLVFGGARTVGYSRYLGGSPSIHYRLVSDTLDLESGPVILTITPYNAYREAYTAYSFYEGMAGETHTAVMDIRGRYAYTLH
ncbi:hypothetical protein KIPB_006490 [Kipferlia bialata]|uniref:Uncharacterized protein n=1 Tax=Kipferlia bialata TaxID=797122 RepID=A0A391NUJ0_9EUKA|nr:hypothetical protein KIPB_006490 [Kipferlia bialata]|eukprot:g6490.t1